MARLLAGAERYRGSLHFQGECVKGNGASNQQDMQVKMMKVHGRQVKVAALGGSGALPFVRLPYCLLCSLLWYFLFN